MTIELWISWRRTLPSIDGITSTTRERSLAWRAVIVNVDPDPGKTSLGDVEGRRFTIHSLRSVRVISELRGWEAGCEGDTSGGETREESVRYADDREESVRLVVGETAVAPTEAASTPWRVTCEIAG